jgi:SAM-dependent methyltransferase
MMEQPHPINPAEIYENYFVPAMFLPWADVLLRHAVPQPGERVLDVACGTGIVARQVAPIVGSNGQVVAIDMNPTMIAVANALPSPSGAKINWKEGNAMFLPSADELFDLVLCQHGLQFFPDRSMAIEEMRRVLVPEGRALSIVLQALARHPVFEALMQSVARHLSIPLSTVITPFGLSDADELKNLFAAAGFQNVDIVPVSITARFPDPERFVPLAITSSAAAVSGFAKLQSPERTALLDAVRVEVEPVLSGYCDADAVTFPMFAHIAVATK